jgi:hypothetical protein
MPNVCAGRPDGRCPKNSHDDSVKWSTADLFLCPDCLEYRFPTSVSDNACNNATASVERSEILYFIQNKCNLIPFDSVVSICADFYTIGEIEAARSLIAERISTSKRVSKHTGSDEVKRRKTVTDLVKWCLDPTVSLPAFYSVDMSRIPAVGVEHVDVSALLQEVAALRAEVRSFTVIRSEISCIRDALTATQSSILSAAPASHVQNVQSTITQSAVVDGDASSLLPLPVVLTPNTDSMSTSNTRGIKPFNVVAGDLISAGMKERPRKTHRLVVGQAASSKIKSVIMKRDVDLFVSRLHPTTSENDIIDCIGDILGSEYISASSCVRLKPKYEDHYSSFHISVSVNVSDLKNILGLLNSPESWPEGTIVRRFFKSKNG